MIPCIKKIGEVGECVVVHACNPNTREMEIGKRVRSLKIALAERERPWFRQQQ